MGSHFNADKVANEMSESREFTRKLIGLAVSESDLRRQPAADFRPILWHLGHVAAFEGYWILQRVKGDPPISKSYDRIFDPIKTPRDSTSLPPIGEMDEYIDRVRDEVVAFLYRVRGDETNSLINGGYVFDLVIQHEYQHQETIAYLLQMIEPDSKRMPGAPARSDQRDSLDAPVSYARSESSSETAMITVAGGPFEMGSSGHEFAYDNEMPAHMVELPDFRIDKYPVTNAEFASFIEEGGYRNRSLWSERGWSWREENRVECPLYWRKVEPEGSRGSILDRWRERDMFEEAPLRRNLPATGVSWYEAEAYARFAGKRLPTEAEWEKAASWDPGSETKRRFSWSDDLPRAGRANFGGQTWGPTPVTAFPEGRSAYGCFDMTGNVWEWTSSVFAGYAGFEAHPYREYSQIWFDGDHRVMKGGSWITRSPLLRCSFRNFWRPRFRIAFAGFRCAAD